MDKLKVFQDKVLVKVSNKKETTSGGLFIPEVNRDEPTEGVVVAMGEGKILKNGKVRGMDFKVGNKVLFKERAGNDIKIDGEEFVVMEEDEIMGVIED